MPKMASADICEALLKRIIAGGMSAGERLKEIALAEEFGVSRTPVREALRQLEQDGLVEIIPGQGAKVVPLTADDIEDVYDIRLSLELLALDIAGTGLRLQRLKEIADLMRQFAGERDYRKHAEIDRSLHDYLVQSTGRRYLIAMYSQTGRLMQRFRSLGFREPEVLARATREHLEFIEAVLVRNLDRAREVMRDHIENSKLCALAQLHALAREPRPAR